MRTLYRASRVYSLSSRQPGEWILIDDRHVERVGVGEPPSADRVVDLVGATVLPGFIDSHVHLTGTGVHLQAPELGTAASRAELLDVVRRVVEGREGPVLVHGYDESKWADRTVPTIADLDAVSDRPLAVVRVDALPGRLAVEHAWRFPVGDVDRQNTFHLAIAVLGQIDGVPELILRHRGQRPG
jgi:predicted amidohydrolase YtcJ